MKLDLINEKVYNEKNIRLVTKIIIDSFVSKTKPNVDGIISPLRTITVLSQALYGAWASAPNALQKRYPTILHPPPVFIISYTN